MVYKLYKSCKLSFCSTCPRFTDHTHACTLLTCGDATVHAQDQCRKRLSSHNNYCRLIEQVYVITASYSISVLSYTGGVALQLHGVTIPNNSLVDVNDLLYRTDTDPSPTNANGLHNRTLVCVTDLEDCCGSPRTVRGDWYYSDGRVVQFYAHRNRFLSNKGPNEVLNGQQFYGSVRLFYRWSRPPGKGRFRCELPSADDPTVNQTLYANVGECLVIGIWGVTKQFIWPMQLISGPATGQYQLWPYLPLALALLERATHCHAQQLLLILFLYHRIFLHQTSSGSLVQMVTPHFPLVQLLWQPFCKIATPIQVLYNSLLWASVTLGYTRVDLELDYWLPLLGLLWMVKGVVSVNYCCHKNPSFLQQLVMFPFRSLLVDPQC